MAEKSFILNPLDTSTTPVILAYHVSLPGQYSMNKGDKKPESPATILNCKHSRASLNSSNSSNPILVFFGPWNMFCHILLVLWGESAVTMFLLDSMNCNKYFAFSSNGS